MLKSALTDPDLPPWPAAPGHNADVSRLIRTALRRYAAGKAQPFMALAERAYHDAYIVAARCLPLRRSPHQDMFIHYALGSALVGLEHLSEGIGHLDAAVSAAEASGDLWASAELADVLGVALRGLGRYLDAEDVYRDGLAALEDLRSATPLQHPSGLRLQVGLAAMLQANERFDEAPARVMIARAGAIALGDREAQAGMDLTEANVQRARGNPHAALALILAARDGYVAVGETRVSRLMLGRVQAFAAEMALDVA
ncbi:MAG TPA: hypothetical protein VGR57_11435, partial [Ktedonobacterales bacterium]|nr:hypothetical protein [Ktedonobacterales bacterium]